jgi:hypothetical protein
LSYARPLLRGAGNREPGSEGQDYQLNGGTLVRRNRSSTRHPYQIAEAWQAIARAAADLEARKRAVAVDQVAAVISNYSVRTGFPDGEEQLTHDEVGYLAATDVRLHFWVARSMEVEVPLAVFSNGAGHVFEPKELEAGVRKEKEEHEEGVLVERLRAS